VPAQLQPTPVPDDTRMIMLLPFLGRRLRRSALAPGRYLTDGRGLFRVLSRFDDGRSLLIVIEECVTLESYACAARELEAMGFRPVGGRAPYEATAVSGATGSAGAVRSRAASSG
jgi:hypothetical protein